MDIVIWLVIGFIAGFLALLVVHRRVPREPIGLIGALLIGLVGGFVGGWIMNLLGLEAVNWLGSIIVAFLAAAGILMLLHRAGTGRSLP